MKTRRQHVLEDRQKILRRISKLNADGNSLQIPIDLVIEIFLRLPVESIARCRCVSKLWANLLVRPDFTDSFLTRSSARPQLLFACHNRSSKGGVFYFSAPQSQKPDESSSNIAANYHMKFSFDDIAPMCSPVSGFFCIRDTRILKGRKSEELVSVICNPSTGQSFTLPKMKTRKRTWMRSFLGYDPIEKQHKVLAMTDTLREGTAEHQVLTLGGTGKLTWRMIECGVPHDSPGLHAICINGVLYFKAKANISSYGHDMIVSFDVRFEKYSFVKVMGRLMHHQATLLNYNGKLAIMWQRFFHTICSTSKSFEMWILQDPENHEWSKHVYKLPLWKYRDAVHNLFFAGVLTGTNEIVVSSRSFFVGSFHVYYYNLERGTIRQVKVKGLEAFDGDYTIDTFVNHAEDVKLMKLF